MLGSFYIEGQNFTSLLPDGSIKVTGFMLWHGVVEDNSDPLMMGAMRVRCIGFHNPDRAKMPTNTLPWALPVISPSGANSTSGLQIGDWVTGYFEDGYEAQKPRILGKLYGIVPKNLLSRPEVKPPKDFNELFISKDSTSFGLSFSQIPLSREQLKILQNKPIPNALLFNAKGKRVDRPDSPALGRETVEGTAVDLANKNRTHVCDISAEMKRAAALARVSFGVIMQGIRAAIKAILAALGFNPESESGRFIELAKKILNVIKRIQSFIDEINDFATIVLFYARQVRAMIDWILSLPKALAALIAGCLNELLSAAAAGFSDLIAGGSATGGLSTTVTDIISSSQKLVNDTTKLLNVPGQVVGVLTTPSTPSDTDSLMNNMSTIISYTTKFSTSNNSTSNIQRP